MIDTDKCKHILYDTMPNPIDVHNVAEELLAEVKRLREEVSSVIRDMLSESEESPSWGATVYAYIKDLQKVIE